MTGPPFQSIHKCPFLKGVVIPVAFAATTTLMLATATLMIARGIYNTSHGIGKKE